jgi:dihydroxyacid dehydratase/phosphogluconate dehydratase
MTREAFENAIVIIMVLGGSPTRYCTYSHGKKC